MARCRAAFFVTRGAGTRRRRRGGLCRQRVHMRLDGDVAGCELRLARVVEREVLLQDEEVLGPVMPGERRDDLGVRRVTAMIAMRGQLLRIAVTGDDVAQNAEAGDAGDIADDERQLHIHLHQGFLHAQHVHAARLEQGMAVTQIRPERDDLRPRPKTRPEEADAVQVTDPLAVGDIGLPARHILEMARIDEEHLEAAGLQDLVDRNPVHPGGFHGHTGHATGRQPIGEPDHRR